MKKYIRQLVAGFLIICMMFIQIIGNKVELLAAENGNLDEYVITTKNQRVVKRIKEKYDKFVLTTTHDMGIRIILLCIWDCQMSR
ncbi:MAG: hypothetical protein HFG36_10165 [Eubacterium sp.]|nr:hypothetical protein [Eubacterium sp.]